MLTSIIISRTQIAAVIQAWLNAEVLRTPQAVTSYELDDGAVSIALAPLPEPVEGPLVAAPLPEPVEGPHQEQQEASAAPAAPKSARAMPRRRLDATDREYIALYHAQGRTVAEIAAARNLAQSSVRQAIDETVA